MIRKIRNALRRWWECRTKTCSYYEHYLAYGPAELTHEGFHAAERKCDEWQRKDDEWLRAHPDKIDSPYRHLCEVWEKRVRA